MNSENAAFDEGNDVSNVPDDDSIYYYLVNYCRNNPLKDPWVLTQSAKYSEQVGKYLQLKPNNGEIIYL